MWKNKNNNSNSIDSSNKLKGKIVAFAEVLGNTLRRKRNYAMLVIKVMH